jgi:ABC-type transport system substrate-binding protein
MNRADADEESYPARAAAVWAAVDRAVTDEAPWVPLVNLTDVDFLSTRVSHYEYNPAWGVLLDQLVIGR